MTQGILKSLAALGAIALVGLLGLTVLATGGGSGDEPGSGGGGFLHHLHQMGHHLHHGGHHDHMAELIDDLGLTPEQHGHLEGIHEILGAFGRPGHGSMAELHEQLVERFEAGPLDSGEIRTLVDGHLEEVRVMAHGAADEMVALVNSLDESQRQVLREHLESRGHAQGH